ncbi:MAG: glycosyltransferase family 39 protein [Candidatus Shapirobacteria bacterium]
MFKKKFFLPLLLLVLTIPAFFFFLKPGNLYWNMQDDMQMMRQLEFEKCLKDGQIPCRWNPDLGFGYGYPLFNFYPPLPSLVGQIFRTFSLSFVQSVKFTAVLQFVLAALFMYLLASSLFGKFGGFISALFYTYVPYHALNIYVRGAMNEAWAAVFFPLIFYFSRKIILKKKIIDILGLGISFACLFLSHNPMVLTFTPILFVWVLFWLWQTYGLKVKLMIPSVVKLIFSGLLSLSLAAFFTLPVLFETKLVQVESMFQNYYSFSAHFVSIKQLFFSNFWGDGPSVWGTADGMSFMVGFVYWILAILTVFYFTFISIKDKKIDRKLLLPILLIFIGFIAIFMTHERSTFLWITFKEIQKVQFPWRFLNHSAFLFSLSAGILPYILNKIFSKKITISIIISILIFLFATNISHFYPIYSGPLTDDQKFSGNSWTRQITSSIYDYLPKTASTAAKSAAKPYVDNIEPQKAFVSFSGEKKGTDWLFFNLFLNQEAKITISQLAFPNFEITNKGEKIDYKIEPELGRMVIDLKSGDHQIYVKLKNTPIRTISNYISLFAWLGLVLYLLKPLWKKLIFRK